MYFVSTHSRNLVVDAETQLHVLSDNEKMVLLNRIEDDSLHYYLEAVEKVCGKIQTVETEAETVEPAIMASTSSALIHNIDNVENMPSTSKDTEERLRITWNHKDILKLINIYKEHASLFKSQTIRHEKIWKMIDEKMPGFSTEQVKNKFKYLKGRYVKKIENMSDKASGQDIFIFEYFEEFDFLFGKDPNIKPISIASSLKKRKLNEEMPDMSNEDELPYLRNMADIQENNNTLSKENMQTDLLETQKKEKKVVNKIEKMTEVLLDLKQDLNNREKERERRHAENAKQRQEATNAFKDYLKFLKEKEDKK